MLLASLDTLPFVNENPELDNAGICICDMAGKPGVDVFPWTVCCFWISTQQQGQQGIVNELSLLHITVLDRLRAVQQPISSKRGGVMPEQETNPRVLSASL